MPTVRTACLLTALVLLGEKTHAILAPVHSASHAATAIHVEIPARASSGTNRSITAVAHGLAQARRSLLVPNHAVSTREVAPGYVASAARSSCRPSCGHTLGLSSYYPP